MAGGEFLLHAPWWNLSGAYSVGESLLHAPFWNLFVGLGVSIIRPVLESVWLLLGWLLSLTRHVLELSGRTPDEESVLLAPSWHLSRRWEGSVFYTPRAGICLVVRREGVYYTARDGMSRLRSVANFCHKSHDGNCLVFRRRWG